MRRIVPVILLVTFVAALASVVCGAAGAAPPGVLVRAAHTGSTADARPLPGFSYRGVLQAPEYEDIWSLTLGGGQQAIIEMVPPDGEDFRLALFPPGTTTTDDISAAVATSLDAFDPQVLQYVAPDSGGGTYYVCVWSNYSVVDDGSYALEVDIQSPTTDVRVTAPRVPSTVRVNEDYTSTGTLSPRHMPGEESVTVEWQKYSGGRWRSERSERVENEDYGNATRFTVEYSFYGWGSGKMKWRVRAVHRADELHPRKASSWRSFWVKI
jgi:hypothetical protein